MDENKIFRYKDTNIYYSLFDTDEGQMFMLHSNNSTIIIPFDDIVQIVEYLMI